MIQFPIQQINKKLEAYFPINNIISIFGEFGVGKTTLCLQIIENLISKNQKIFYLYTKPKIPINRINDILNGKKNYADIDKLNLIKISKFEDLYDFVFKLENLLLLEEKSKGITRNITKLLIIDSLTDLYKLELNSEKKERNVRLNYQLNQILATLTYLARVYDITIIVVNETSRKKIKDEFILFPSGGNVVDYWVRFSILIKRFDKLNARIFFLKIKDDNQEFQFTLNLTKRGFFK
ncbi:MAG: hypothetical protein GF317_15540 [Candidatus Lokiarchaeota archaeon]|nr:hypothetical protein [Candidatus Lokiarchaeota archaeon]MBD3200976.1 hypothetical protein [Candidatus Lokiarchaeota archaeon]